MVNVDYLQVWMWPQSGCGRGPESGPGLMVNVDYLQVLIGLSLDVAVGQKVALVSW